MNHMEDLPTFSRQYMNAKSSSQNPLSLKQGSKSDIHSPMHECTCITSSLINGCLEGNNIRFFLFNLNCLSSLYTSRYVGHPEFCKSSDYQWMGCLYSVD